MNRQPLPSRRTWLGATTLGLLLPVWHPGSAFAQNVAATPARAQRTDVVVPIYGADGFLASHWTHVDVPAAQAFALETQGLAALWAAEPTRPVEDLLRTARASWVKALAPWLRLTAVATGPLIERRSLKAIDFQPSRPELIRRAIERATDGPLDAAALERIGTPAKGLPALELLLWSTPAEFERTDALRHYVRSVSEDLAREARELSQAWTTHAALERDDEQVAGAMAEWINQLLGGVELLRWRDIERPTRARQPDRIPFPRQRSGQVALAWHATWQALRDRCRTPATWPEPGQGLVPLGLYLRSLGQVTLADRLDIRLDRIERALNGLKPQDHPNRLLAAAKELAPLKALIENEVASAVRVRIGFSDNDGD